MADIKVRVGQQNAIRVASSIAGGADSATRSTNVIGGIASVTDLYVSGITTLSGQVNFSQSSLNVSGVSTFADDLNVNGNLKVEGSSEFVGDVTFRAGTGGTINLGNSDLDNINIGGEFTSALIPDSDDTYDIGSTLKRWRDASFSDLVKSGRLEVTGASLFSGPTVFSDDVSINTTDSLKIPSGTTAQRNSSPVTGQIRYNTTLSSFEGYGPANTWVDLGGVRDADRDTYIIAEGSPGSDQDILTFVAANQTELTINTNTSTFSNNVVINGNLTATGEISFTEPLTFGDLTVFSNFNVSGTSIFGNTVTLNDITYFSNGSYDINRSGTVTNTDILAFAYGSIPTQISIANTTNTAGINFTELGISDYFSSLIGQEISTQEDAGSFSIFTKNTEQKYATNYINAELSGMYFGASKGFGFYRAVETGSTPPTSILSIDDNNDSKVDISIDLNVQDHTTINTLNVSGISTFNDRVIFDSTNSIQIPTGTDAEKDSVGTAVTGQIRYNTTNSQFEGFGAGNNWGSLGGVKDVDGDTYIIPESSPSSDEDALTFYTAGSQKVVIDSAGNFGIGITNPDQLLVVNGRADFNNINVSGLSTITDQLEIKSSDGSSGKIDFYCEFNNAHYTRVQAAPHAEYSGNVTAILPTIPGDIIVGDTSTDITQSVRTTGIITATQFSTGSSNIGITSNTITGPSLLIIDPSTVDDISGAVRIRGDLYVEGTEFVINSTTVNIADYRIGIGTSAPNDTELDGAGIGIGSEGHQKTFVYDNLNTALKSSENINLSGGKVYQIDGNERLSANKLTLGNKIEIIDDSDDLIVEIDDAEKLRLKNGNLGIGSTNPESTLDINGTLNVSGVSTFGNKVGIGTTAPQASIHIYRQDTVSGQETHADFILENPGKGNARIFLKTRDNNRDWEFFADDTDGAFGIHDGEANRRVFTISTSSYIGVGTAFNTQTQPLQQLDVAGGAHISGNLGIGSTNPSKKLDVDGSISATESLYYSNSSNFNGPNGITYFNSDGKLVGAASTSSGLATTSYYILTTNDLGVPMWTSTIDGGEY